MAQPVDENPGRIPVAVAVVVHEGKLLIAHRFPHPALPDLWEYPGGKVRPGESAEACAVRETAEELGIAIGILGPLCRTSYDYADRRVDLRFFAARWLGGDPRPIGCQEWRWIDPREIVDYPMPAPNAPVIAQLRAKGLLPEE